MLDISGLKLPMIGDRLVGGNVYFVDSGSALASDGNDGLHPVNSPMATLAGALDRCVASNGDFIIMLPGHAESLSATVAIDVIGVTIMGIGNGQLRPTFTFTATAADNMFEVSVADVKIDNIIMTGTAAIGDGETFIDVQAGADRFELCNCYIIQTGGDSDAITMTGGANDVHIHDCEFYSTSAGPDTGINVETSCDRPTFENLIFRYEDSEGIDDACIKFESEISEQILVRNIVGMGLRDAEELIYCTAGTSAGPTGLIMNCYAETTDNTQLWLNSATTGPGFIECYGAEPGTHAGAFMLGNVHPSVTPAA